MTSGPLCLPIGNGRQASRTGPGIKRRHSRLFVAPPGRENLLYYLFLVLLIVGCSSGQGRLEASTDTVQTGGAEVDTSPGWKTLPGQARRPRRSSSRRNRRSTPSPMRRHRQSPRKSLQNSPSQTPHSTSDPAETNQPLDQARTAEEAWEEDGIREEFGEGLHAGRLHGNPEQEGFKYSYLDDPPRLVVDVKEPAREVWFNRLSLKGGAFERIRVGRHPDKIRFVLDLREEGQPEPLVETRNGSCYPGRRDPRTRGSSRRNAGSAGRTGTNMQAATTEGADVPSAVVVAGAIEESDMEPVPMGGPDVPITVAKADRKPVRVKGIDFRQTDSASDVIISTDGAVQFDVQEKDDSIIVVLSGAQIPEHLQRLIDTKAFPSAILAVRPEQIGAGPTGKVMFTIRLREKRPYNVLEEENGVRVSVLLPETPPEIPLLPPPALPETEGLAQAEQEPPPEPEPASPEPEVEIKVAKEEAPKVDPVPQDQRITQVFPQKRGLRATRLQREEDLS